MLKARNCLHDFLSVLAAAGKNVFHFNIAHILNAILLILFLAWNPRLKTEKAASKLSKLKKLVKNLPGSAFKYFTAQVKSVQQYLSLEF